VRSILHCLIVIEAKLSAYPEQPDVTSFLHLPFRGLANWPLHHLTSPNLALRPHTTNFISSCHFRDQLNISSLLFISYRLLSSTLLSQHIRNGGYVFTPLVKDLRATFCRGVTSGMKTRINAHNCYRRSCRPRHRQWVSEDILSDQWITWTASRAFSRNGASRMATLKLSTHWTPKTIIRISELTLTQFWYV